MGECLLSFPFLLPDDCGAILPVWAKLVVILRFGVRAISVLQRGRWSIERFAQTVPSTCLLIWNQRFLGGLEPLLNL
jgi:hypothetical protein